MTEPKLDAPGAGLPFPDRHFVWYFGRSILRWRFPWDKATAAIEAGATRVLNVTEKLDEETYHRRVLIPPLRGIEDSSRFWSPAMVLEHLNITGQAMSLVVASLSHGRTVDREVSTAAVKPHGTPGRVAETGFRDIHFDKIPRAIAGAGPHRKSPTHLHPWFGRLNAADWLSLLAMHLELHEKQLHAILKQPVPIDEVVAR